MRGTARYSLIVTALGAEIVLGSLAACGSSTQNGPDAGVDGAAEGARPDRQGPRDGGRTHGETGPRDAGPGEGAPRSPGALAYCHAGLSASEACGVFSPACIAELTADSGLAKVAGACAAEWSMFASDGYLQAWATCLSALPSEPNGCCLLDPAKPACADAAAGVIQSEVVPCVSKGLLKIKPDPAAEKLKADFCKTCPAKGSGINPCAGFFDVEEAGIPDGGIDAGSFSPYLNTAGFGSIALVFPDRVIDLIDDQCTGVALAGFDAGFGSGDAGPLACYLRFADCAEVTSQAFDRAHEPSGGAVDASAYPACLPDAAGRG